MAGQTPSESRVVDVGDRTFRFAVRVVDVCQGLEKWSDAARLLARELLQSGTAIGVAVEEASGAATRGEVVNCYATARQRARAAQYWLRLLKACNLGNLAEIERLISESEKLVAILSAALKKAAAK